MSLSQKQTQLDKLNNRRHSVNEHKDCKNDKNVSFEEFKTTF